MNIKIDESRLKEEPSFFSKLGNVIVALFYGALILQILAFLRILTFVGIFGTIVFWYDNPVFLVIEGIFAVLGWVYGAEFTSWLKAKIEEWNIIPENWIWWR